MISLFIDTSLEDVSIALVKEGKELSQIHEYIPGKHSIYVTKYINDILKNNNLSPDNVDEIIVVNGPGSFTGIRIGVTIAKMFAYIKKIRIVTITSLKARVLGHTGNYLLTTIDAKHNNYYVGVYDKEYNTIEEKFTSFKEVEELKDTLYKDGHVQLYGIGDLHYTIHNSYEFRPNEEGILSPYLYGFSSLSISPLSENNSTIASTKDMVLKPPKEKAAIRFNRRWLGNAVAIAVAVILFFFLQDSILLQYEEISYR